MSITSLSFTFVNSYASQSAAPAAAASRQTAPAAETTQVGDDDRPGGGQNRLAEAILSALRELGIASAASSTPAAQPAAGSTVGSTAAGGSSTGASAPASTPASTSGAVAASTPSSSSTAAPATSTTDAAASATTTPPASDAAATVDSAVHEFAHQLFQALRQVATGENSDSDSSHADSVPAGARHHRHHHRREHAYGDLSQRIDALARTFGTSAPAAAASTAQPASGASSSLTITLTVQDSQPAASVGTPASTTPASTTPAAATSTPAANAATTPSASAGTASSSLLQAFTTLFNALKPSSTATTPMDMAGRLRTFLQTLAQALRPEAANSIQTPQIGSLVNVTV